jgi:hypothetical protein
MCLRKWRVLTPFRRLLGVFGGCCGMCCCCGCDPPSPAEALAAKIKAEEACACSRRAAVRYLGRVDCHYYPEAEEALIAALRCDRNCCVRLEAAMGLGNGCCCTPRVIERLTMVVSGSEADGNPHETSPQVRFASFNSLQRLLAFYDSCHRGQQSRAAKSAEAFAEASTIQSRPQCAAKPSQVGLAEAVARARQTIAQHPNAPPTPSSARNLLDVVAHLGKPRPSPEMGRKEGERYFPSLDMTAGDSSGRSAALSHIESGRNALDLPESGRAATPKAAALCFDYESAKSLLPIDFRATQKGGAKDSTDADAQTCSLLAEMGLAPGSSSSAIETPAFEVKMPPASAIFAPPPATRYLPIGLAPIGRIPPSDEVP